MIRTPERAIPASRLDVHFINTLPVLVASRHSRESGNPGDERHGDWMPAYAGMTFYWRRTYETDGSIGGKECVHGKNSRHRRCARYSVVMLTMLLLGCENDR